MNWRDDYWFGQRYDDAVHAQTEGMTSPVRCRCGHVYDLGKVEVTARYADCSMWRTPCCKVLADDRKPPWGISWDTELPRRDRAFLIADEDVTFPEDERGEEAGR